MTKDRLEELIAGKTSFKKKKSFTLQQKDGSEGAEDNELGETSFKKKKSFTLQQKDGSEGAEDNELGMTSLKKKKSFTSQQTDGSEGAEDNELTALTGPQLQPKIVKTKNKNSGNLDKVYQQVSNINGQITRIKEDIVQLRRYHLQMQLTTRTETRTRELINSLNENIMTTALKIKSELEDLEKEKKGDEEMVIYRVAKTQHALLTKSFRDTMEDYETTLATHQQILEDVIKKQLKITDREVTDEELCNILEAEDTAVFVDNYTKEVLEARQSLEYARDIYKQLLVTEKNIEIIRDMVFSIAMHVMQQGELIERIEDHIGNGLALTQQGQRKINKAEKFRQRARKKKCWMLICLAIVIVILVTYILLQIYVFP